MHLSRVYSPTTWMRSSHAFPHTHLRLSSSSSSTSLNHFLQFCKSVPPALNLYSNVEAASTGPYRCSFNRVPSSSIRCTRSSSLCSTGLPYFLLFPSCNGTRYLFQNTHLECTLCLKHSERGVGGGVGGLMKVQAIVIERLTSRPNDAGTEHSSAIALAHSNNPTSSADIEEGVMYPPLRPVVWQVGERLNSSAEISKAHWLHHVNTPVPHMAG